MATMRDTNVLAETENMIIWRSEEDEAGYIVHVELGGVTLHLLPEEWDEFLILMNNISA